MNAHRFSLMSTRFGSWFKCWWQLMAIFCEQQRCTCQMEIMQTRCCLVCLYAFSVITILHSWSTTSQTQRKGLSWNDASEADVSGWCWSRCTRWVRIWSLAKISIFGGEFSASSLIVQKTRWKANTYTPCISWEVVCDILYQVLYFAQFLLNKAIIWCRKILQA